MNHQRESIVNEPEGKSINEDYEIKLGGTQFTISIMDQGVENISILEGRLSTQEENIEVDIWYVRWELKVVNKRII